MLALHAIVAYDEWRSANVVPGVAQVAVDGVVLASARINSPPRFPGPSSRVPSSLASVGLGGEGGPVVIQSAALEQALASPGSHAVRLTFIPDWASGPQKEEAAYALPFSMEAKWATLHPPSDSACAVGLHTRLSHRELGEGESGELNVEVTVLPAGLSATAVGVDGGGVPMVTAVVGVPGGLEVDDERLRLLRGSPAVDYVERLGASEVALYWRSLPMEATRIVVIPFVAAVPGTYTGKAGRAYLYYTDEYKSWAEPLVVKIEPREER